MVAAAEATCLAAEQAAHVLAAAGLGKENCVGQVAPVRLPSIPPYIRTHNCQDKTTFPCISSLVYNSIYANISDTTMLPNPVILPEAMIWYS